MFQDRARGRRRWRAPCHGFARSWISRAEGCLAGAALAGYRDGCANGFLRGWAGTCALPVLRPGFRCQALATAWPPGASAPPSPPGLRAFPLHRWRGDQGVRAKPCPGTGGRSVRAYAPPSRRERVQIGVRQEERRRVLTVVGRGPRPAPDRSSSVRRPLPPASVLFRDQRWNAPCATCSPGTGTLRRPYPAAGRSGRVLDVRCWPNDRRSALARRPTSSTPTLLTSDVMPA